MSVFTHLGLFEYGTIRSTLWRFLSEVDPYLGRGRVDTHWAVFLGTAAPVPVRQLKGFIMRVVSYVGEEEDTRAWHRPGDPRRNSI